MFKPVPCADIAIFDTHTADKLCEVLSGYSVFTIDARGESIYFLILLEAFLKFLRLCGKKKLSVLYYSTFVNRLNAKICITNQDAHQIFFDLARDNVGVKFIALQQGLKTEFSIGNFSKIYGDYFSFGPAYAEKLDNGEASVFVGGSLKANSAEFDIGKYVRVSYISGFVSHQLDVNVFCNYNYAEFSYPAIYSSLRLVDEFCAKNKIDLILTSKSFRERSGAERSYVLKNEIQLYENVLGKKANIAVGDSYKISGESQLVICDQSALGYELLGRGCKVVFLNFISHFLHSPSYKFGWPLELPNQGPFWSSVPDPVYIEKILTSVWNMSKSEWDEVAGPYKEKLMVYDKGHSILHGKIKAILDSSEHKTNDAH